MLIPDNAGKQKKRSLFNITPWREILLDPFLWIIITHYIFLSFNKWKCWKEKRFLVAWALMLQETVSKCYKQNQTGWCTELFRDGLRKWHWTWGLNGCVLSSKIIWYENASDKDLSKNQGPGVAWVCPCVLETERGQKNREGKGRKRWSPKGEIESHNTSQARSLDFILNTQKSHWKVLSRTKGKKLIICLLKTTLTAKWGWTIN